MLVEHNSSLQDSLIFVCVWGGGVYVYVYVLIH